MGEANLNANKMVVRRAWAAYDRCDTEAFLGCLSPDWKEYGGAEGDLSTIDDVIRSMDNHRGAFPDKHTTIEQEVAERDLVVVRTVTTATHTGRYFDLEPTGKSVRTHEISIHRVSSGRIVETWRESTAGGFYQQRAGRPAPARVDNMG